MGIKELGLGLATVATFAIPPASTIRVQIGTTGALDVDLVSLDLEKRTSPLLIAPGGLALKDDLSYVR